MTPVAPYQVLSKNNSRLFCQIKECQCKPTTFQIILWDLMFCRPSQFSLYFFYGTWRRVVWYQLSKILEEPTASILSAFTKLRKAATSFVMSLRPSVLCPLGTTRIQLDGFSWNSIFRKSVGKIQVWLKSDKNNGYFTYIKTSIQFLSIPLNSY
jgi:hypothetical protein